MWFRRWLQMWSDDVIVLESPLSQAAATSALATGLTGLGSRFFRGMSFGIGPRIVAGRVSADYVRLAAMRPGVQNGWRPSFTGKLAAHGATTQLVGKIGVPTAVKIFSAAWLGGVACFFVTGLVGGLDELARGRVGEAGGWFAFTAATIGFAGFFMGLTWFASRSGKKDEAYLRQWLQDRLQSHR